MVGELSGSPLAQHPLPQGQRPAARGHRVGQHLADRGDVGVGVLGIALKDGHRDVGIGTELMREAEAQAGRLGLEMIQLSVFENNERARHVYRKAGYRDAGVWPRAIKKGDAYIDEILMSKELPK